MCARVRTRAIVFVHIAFKVFLHVIKLGHTSATLLKPYSRRAVFRMRTKPSRRVLRKPPPILSAAAAAWLTIALSYSLIKNENELRKEMHCIETVSTVWNAILDLTFCCAQSKTTHFNNKLLCVHF